MSRKRWLIVFLVVLLGAGTILIWSAGNKEVTGKGMDIPEPEPEILEAFDTVLANASNEFGDTPKTENHELAVSMLEDNLKMAQEKLVLLEERLQRTELDLSYMDEELECYKHFVHYFMDKISPEDLKKYALKLWEYSLLIGNEPIEGPEDWEPFPQNGVADGKASGFRLLLRESQPVHPVLPLEIYQSGKIGEIEKYGYFDHLKITSQHEYELQGAAGTVVDSAIFVFKDIPAGAEVKISISQDLQQRLGMETTELKVNVK